MFLNSEQFYFVLWNELIFPHFLIAMPNFENSGSKVLKISTAFYILCTLKPKSWNPSLRLAPVIKKSFRFSGQVPNEWLAVGRFVGFYGNKKEKTLESIEIVEIFSGQSGANILKKTSWRNFKRWNFFSSSSASYFAIKRLLTMFCECNSADDVNWLL